MTRAPVGEVESALVGVVEGRLAERAKAREMRDFALSDAIRDELLASGVAIADSAVGTTWKRVK